MGITRYLVRSPDEGVCPGPRVAPDGAGVVAVVGGHVLVRDHHLGPLLLAFLKSDEFYLKKIFPIQMIYFKRAFFQVEDGWNIKIFTPYLSLTWSASVPATPGLDAWP